MRGGQQQLEELQSEIESRDKLLMELQREMELERLSAADKERQLEVTWEAKERQAKAEVEAKVQVCISHAFVPANIQSVVRVLKLSVHQSLLPKELRHRVGDIEVLKDELRKVKEETKALRKPRPALPSDPRALQQLSHNNNPFKR